MTPNLLSSEKANFAGSQVAEYFNYMSATDQERIRLAVVRAYRKAAKAKAALLLQQLNVDAEGQPWIWTE